LSEVELRGKLVFLQFDGAAVRRAGACENFAVIEWRRGFHNAAYETSLHGSTTGTWARS